jgi:hypothetical protein
MPSEYIHVLILYSLLSLLFVMDRNCNHFTAALLEGLQIPTPGYVNRLAGCVSCMPACCLPKAYRELLDPPAAPLSPESRVAMNIPLTRQVPSQRSSSIGSASDTTESAMSLLTAHDMGGLTYRASANASTNDASDLSLSTALASPHLWERRYSDATVPIETKVAIIDDDSNMATSGRGSLPSDAPLRMGTVAISELLTNTFVRSL